MMSEQAGQATSPRPAAGDRLRVGMVAGESSGDQLGAALMAAIRERRPDAQFMGVAGPKMIAAGCEEWAPAEELSVLGLAEVLRHAPRLLRLRTRLAKRFLETRPDVFIGVDAPGFNVDLLAGRLKEAGIPTVQYVSPQVWAWRQGRVRTIGRACDLVLCLLPFETQFYSQHRVRAVFVGHPLADQIPLEVDRESACTALGIDPNATVVALLPGSRLGEVERLSADFVGAAAWLEAKRPGLRFVAPMASPRVRTVFERQIGAAPQAPAIQLFDGQAQSVLAAANAAIVASGTATLETLLTGRPMVVAYRISALSAFLVRTLGLVKVPYFSQPNLLIGRRLVPEFIQEAVTPAALGAALLNELEDRAYSDELKREFARVHVTLRCGGAALAAAAILELVEERRA